MFFGTRTMFVRDRSVIGLCRSKPGGVVEAEGCSGTAEMTWSGAIEVESSTSSSASTEPLAGPGSFGKSRRVSGASGGTLSMVAVAPCMLPEADFGTYDTSTGVTRRCPL